MYMNIQSNPVLYSQPDKGYMNVPVNLYPYVCMCMHMHVFVCIAHSELRNAID